MGECRAGQTCEVPTKQPEGNRREWQGMNRVQVAEQVQVTGGTFRPGKGLLRPFHFPSSCPHCLALNLIGVIAHVALSHLSSLQDSWEGCEAQHVPIGAGRRAGGGWPSAPGLLCLEKKTLAEGPLGVQTPRPCPSPPAALSSAWETEIILF